MEKKKDVVRTMQMEWRRNLEHVREEHVSLRYLDLDNQMPDVLYNKYRHRWWLRCRVGALFLGYKRRNEREQICPICEEQIETREHFLWECGGGGGGMWR